MVVVLAVVSRESVEHLDFLCVIADSAGRDPNSADLAYVSLDVRVAILDRGIRIRTKKIHGSLIQGRNFCELFHHLVRLLNLNQ